MTSEEMVKLAQLEQRVTDLEEADRKHVEFRKEYYQDREDRIRRDTRLDSKLDNICADIKTLLAWREVQVNKPAKKWESAVELVFKLILTAAVGVLLYKVGLA